MKPKPNADLAELCAVLASAGPAPDRVPPGWFTKNDYMAAQRIGKTRAHEKLQRGFLSGVIEVKDFRIHRGNSVRPVPHYRVKK